MEEIHIRTDAPGTTEPAGTTKKNTPTPASPIEQAKRIVRKVVETITGRRT